MKISSLPDRFRFFVLLFFLFGCQENIRETTEGKIIGITDGDTVRMLLNGKSVKIRLSSIDAPEISQDFGQRSKQFLSHLVFHKRVLLVTHGKDRYGRVLGELLLPEGINVNEEMVKKGFAWHYRKYSDDQRLQEFEKEARTKRLGIWQQKHPVPPWEFRYQKRQKRQDNKKSQIQSENQLHKLIACQAQKNHSNQFIDIKPRKIQARIQMMA